MAEGGNRNGTVTTIPAKGKVQQGKLLIICYLRIYQVMFWCFSEIQQLSLY